ncbi:glycine cleavage system protein GcvH [Allofrancisella guangzhouensis]|uniref:Glycine cleavage system H protein n=1 Tax=Allofrancisella guangzhouensis TaxID=594679 RepID=A0A0A8E4X9_9GAMM|nr:glycine cleavage system protein GcvH [Allofrancisella guangzhouensis]AJC49295.1 glycine cleavage system protein H [Allofrancisella guangzhouensis]MBK2027192.1 glycine cleavage system protein GcvH [Allofrancisella guangzhouensis]MBK2044628.1 glycine cleavage system protein GcvH [Allofrancisella guangzhouensis]MBK2045089.1 glycine cleavage system protein GcvH [Allofrancisella guangzhouensis]
MPEINKNYLYTQTNEWIQIKDNVARVGVDDYSQNEFGEIVYVDLPKFGHHYDRDEEICVIESVKTASDIYSPLSGKVVKINEKLIDNPKLINRSCYDEGWIFELEFSDPQEIDQLLKPNEYEKYISE